MVDQDYAGLLDLRYDPPPAVQPYVGDLDIGGVIRTQGFKQYRPTAGQDGHFVAFDPLKGRPDVMNFLLMALDGQTPAIGL